MISPTTEIVIVMVESEWVGVSCFSPETKQLRKDERIRIAKAIKRIFIRYKIGVVDIVFQESTQNTFVVESGQKNYAKQPLK